MQFQRQLQLGVNEDSQNQEQLNQDWKSYIQRIDVQLINLYGQQKLETNIHKAFQLYSSACIPVKDLELIQGFIQVKYPNIPMQQVLKKLYHCNQWQLQLSQHANRITQFLQQSLRGKDPANLIDCLHQYLNSQNHLPQALKQYPRTQIEIPSILKCQGYPSSSPVNFYDQLQDQNPQSFSGVILNNGTDQLKHNIQTFNGQKKVVHVYTKKGYGIEIYRNHLELKKMDKKEWDYYHKELVQNNNYDFYLLSAIHATLNIVVQFVKNLRQGKYFKDTFSHFMDEEEFNQIINSIFQIDGILKKHLNDCLRVVFELKIEKEIHKQSVIQLFNQLSHIRNMNQQVIKKRREISLMNDLDQILPLIQYDDDEF